MSGDLIEPTYVGVPYVDPREWSDSEFAWVDDDDAFGPMRFGRCQHCGREAPVRSAIDPYIDEVSWPKRENPPSDWCHPCWKERKDEV